METACGEGAALTRREEKVAQQSWLSTATQLPTPRSQTLGIPVPAAFISHKPERLKQNPKNEYKINSKK
jgi:hypothetical protein